VGTKSDDVLWAVQGRAKIGELPLGLNPPHSV